MGAAPQAPRTRVTARARDLRFDAGTLSLNLVATVGRRPAGPVERMGDTERLAAWCRGVGLAPAPGYEAEALLRSLHALRDAAYDIASSLLDGHRPSPRPWTSSTSWPPLNRPSPDWSWARTACDRHPAAICSPRTPCCRWSRGT